MRSAFLHSTSMGEKDLAVLTCKLMAASNARGSKSPHLS